METDTSPSKTASRLRRLRATEPGWSTAKNAKYQTENREKYLAHKAVANALVAGRIERGVCEVCGSMKVEAHHDDYAKRLEIRWLCRHHHLAHHQNESQRLV